MDNNEEIGRCPWCGERGVGFAGSPRPSDYCGHDPALVRSSSVVAAHAQAVAVLGTYLQNLLKAKALPPVKPDWDRT